MASHRKHVDRRVVPRFHSLASALRQGEGSALSAASERPLLARSGSLATLSQDWSAHGGLAFAGDLVSGALVLGDSEIAVDAARMLLEHSASPLARHVAARLLNAEGASPDDDGSLALEQLRFRVRELKLDARNDPRSAIAQAELARHYAALGQRSHAATAMHRALLLAPTNRYILRSAVRLQLHLADPERAHRLLLDAPQLGVDPWLVAAEIAVASSTGRRSRLIKYGRRMLDSRRFDALTLSELASAVGTEALNAGSAKEARRRFADSLNRPTENAVAQAAWASTKDARIMVDDATVDEASAYEARANLASEAGHEEDAIASTWAWLRDEPFSALPAVFGSHQASLARKYDEALEFADFGILANPDEFLLRNNAAFASASLDRVAEAEDYLTSLNESALTEDDRVILTATRGLVAFRSGRLAEARERYGSVVKDAKDSSVRAVAATVWAREEARLDPVVAEQLVGIADRLVDEALRDSGTHSDTVAAWRDHLRAELEVTRPHRAAGRTS